MDLNAASNSYPAIYIGISTGVLSAWIAWLISVMLKEYVIPKYKATMHTTIDVSGSWEISSPNYDRRIIKLNIRQSGDSLEGISTHVIKNDNSGSTSERIRTYKITGTIRDRFVVLTGRPLEKGRIGAIAFVFEVVGDGQTLIGYGTGYSSSQKAIGSMSFSAQIVSR
jgi:hypothetical protein